MNETIKIEIEKLAKLLGLPDQTSIDELNQDMIWEAGDCAYKEALAEHAKDCERLREDVAESVDASEWPAEITTAEPAPEGLSFDDGAEQAAEAAREKAEGAASDEVYRSYRGALDAVFERYLAHHGMAFTECEGEPWNLEITPLESWENAASKVRETIEGVGMFGWGSLEEFIASSSCEDARDVVESHLHWLKSYGEVYGDYSPKHIYERSFR